MALGPSEFKNYQKFQQPKRDACRGVMGGHNVWLQSGRSVDNESFDQRLSQKMYGHLKWIRSIAR